MDSKYIKTETMRKLFAVIAFFFATTIGANAQEDPNVLAKIELNLLSKVVDLENSSAMIINDLLIYKHESNAKFPENKKLVAQTIEDKLKGILTPEQFEKVKSNKKLFEDLIN